MKHVSALPHQKFDSLFNNLWFLFLPQSKAARRTRIRSGGTEIMGISGPFSLSPAVPGLTTLFYRAAFYI